ncbi:MAG: dethiobiotin synthase [Planctomycetaceae bacterium]
MKIPGLFIVGTDTGVGKTFVAALLIRELRRLGVRVGAYKPACSGCEMTEGDEPFWPDVNALVDSLGTTVPAERAELAMRVCPQRFAAPAAPPVAARLEGRAVDRQLLDAGLNYWESACECVLIEGIGGLLCPVTESETIADLAVAWNVPLLIVARAGLGTINHTLLTVEAAQRRGLTIAGILLNEVQPVSADDPARFNAAEIACRTDVPVWGVLPHKADRWSIGTTSAAGVNLWGLLFSAR